jgi:hypothetical protein
VTVATARPVLGDLPTEPIAIQGAELPPREAQPWAARAVVSAGYFDTLRIPIVKGRPFGSQDRPGAEPVVVVNQTLARRYVPGAQPIGTRLRVGPAGSPWRAIVGVAGDVLNTQPGAPAIPQVYLPFEQQPARTLTILSPDLERGFGRRGRPPRSGPARSPPAAL